MRVGGRHPAAFGRPSMIVVFASGQTTSPVHASIRCCPRWVVPGSPPLLTGSVPRRSASAGCASSRCRSPVRPLRHPRCGRPCHRPRTGRSRCRPGRTAVAMPARPADRENALALVIPGPSRKRTPRPARPRGRRTGTANATIRTAAAPGGLDAGDHHHDQTPGYGDCQQSIPAYVVTRSQVVAGTCVHWAVASPMTVETDTPVESSVTIDRIWGAWSSPLAWGTELGRHVVGTGRESPFAVADHRCVSIHPPWRRQLPGCQGPVPRL
jgi:hypothetical protein